MTINTIALTLKNQLGNYLDRTSEERYQIISEICKYLGITDQNTIDNLFNENTPIEVDDLFNQEPDKKIEGPPIPSNFFMDTEINDSCCGGIIIKEECEKEYLLTSRGECVLNASQRGKNDYGDIPNGDLDTKIPSGVTVEQKLKNSAIVFL